MIVLFLDAQPALDLRPNGVGGARRPFESLRTPRLLLRPSAEPAVRVALRVIDEPDQAASGRPVSVSLAVQPAAHAERGALLGRTSSSDHPLATAPLPAPAVAPDQAHSAATQQPGSTRSTPAAEITPAAAEAGSSQPAGKGGAMSEQQQQQPAAAVPPDPGPAADAGPSMPRSSFSEAAAAAPFMAPEEATASGDGWGGLPLRADPEQAEAHIAASLEASLSPEHGIPDVAAALSVPLPQGDDELEEPVLDATDLAGHGGAAQAGPRGHADNMSAPSAQGHLAEDSSPGGMDEPPDAGDVAEAGGQAEHGGAAPAEINQQAEAGEDTSEDSSWTSVAHPAQKLLSEVAEPTAAAAPPVPEPASQGAAAPSPTALPVPEPTSQGVELESRREQSERGREAAPSAQQDEPPSDNAASVVGALAAQPTSAPEQALPPEQAPNLELAPATGNEAAAMSGREQREGGGRGDAAPAGSTAGLGVSAPITRRLSAPMLPRTGSGTALAGGTLQPKVSMSGVTGDGGDPLNQLGDLAKRSGRLAAMAGDHIMKGIAHAARKRDGPPIAAVAAPDRGASSSEDAERQRQVQTSMLPL